VHTEERTNDLGVDRQYLAAAACALTLTQGPVYGLATKIKPSLSLISRFPSGSST
jgi:hypothetical protein